MGLKTGGISRYQPTKASAAASRRFMAWVFGRDTLCHHPWCRLASRTWLVALDRAGDQPIHLVTLRNLSKLTWISHSVSCGRLSQTSPPPESHTEFAGGTTIYQPTTASAAACRTFMASNIAPDSDAMTLRKTQLPPRTSPACAHSRPPCHRWVVRWQGLLGLLREYSCQADS
jgi:hypothetical protein